MLAARDREILLELDAAYRNLTSLGLQGWCRPMDVGGVSSSSDHSYRLTKLARLGLAEHKQRSPQMVRGSKYYRITEAGRRALQSEEGTPNDRRQA